jgi:hypothetical protein
MASPTKKVKDLEVGDVINGSLGFTMKVLAIRPINAQEIEMDTLPNFLKPEIGTDIWYANSVVSVLPKEVVQ